MEWVETTGRTLEEAKDAALDQLGVDEADAEFQVLEEAKSGLFGRLRQEARVRARVKPTTPRAKAERKDRKRRPAREDGEAATTGPSTDDLPARAPAERPARPPRQPRQPSRSTMDDDSGPDLATQGESARVFVSGLLGAFGATGTTTVEEVDEETVELTVTGPDLGLLIGPKGQTLTAVQDLARTIVSRAAGDARPARLRLDIGGYRERRREALERFTRQVADQVLSSGTATSLEPMSPPDRKVVHDTANTIDGVRTTSEGEEPRRRVVILPDAG